MSWSCRICHQPMDAPVHRGELTSSHGFEPSLSPETEVHHHSPRQQIGVFQPHEHNFIPIEWERVQMQSNVAATWRTRVTRLRCRVGTCEETKDVHHG